MYRAVKGVVLNYLKLVVKKWNSGLSSWFVPEPYEPRTVPCHDALRIARILTGYMKKLGVLSLRRGAQHQFFFNYFCSLLYPQYLECFSTRGTPQ